MTAATPSVSWFALRLRSRFEFAVRDALRAEQIEEFLPTRDETTRWTDRIATTTRPLFPGYIFVRFGSAYTVQLLKIRGVVQILSIDLQPVPIPDDAIANLRRAVEHPAPLSLCPHVAGDSVTVARGPFAGVTGVISRVQGATTLTIPVAILGRAVSVQIDAADVEPPK